MKKLFLFVAVFMCFSLMSVFADPVEGLWKSVDEKSGKVTAVWKIYVQGGKLFGEMLVVLGKKPDAKASKCTKDYPDFPKAGRVSEMPLVGTPFIFNLVKKSEGAWHNGYIIAPDTGKYYYCKVTFRAKDGKKYKTDCLEMRGEIGLGIGRSQLWVRATDAETQNLINSNK